MDNVSGQELLLLRAEEEKLRRRIKDIEHTLEVMPSDTFLGVMCMKAYLKKAMKDLEKVQKEIKNKTI